jgi:hypothetical protein
MTGLGAVGAGALGAGALGAGALGAGALGAGALGAGAAGAGSGAGSGFRSGTDEPPAGALTWGLSEGTEIFSTPPLVESALLPSPPELATAYPAPKAAAATSSAISRRGAVSRIASSASSSPG